MGTESETEFSVETILPPNRTLGDKLMTFLGKRKLSVAFGKEIANLRARGIIDSDVSDDAISEACNRGLSRKKILEGFKWQLSQLDWN